MSNLSKDSMSIILFLGNVNALYGIIAIKSYIYWIFLILRVINKSV